MSVCAHCLALCVAAAARCADGPAWRRWWLWRSHLLVAHACCCLLAAQVASLVMMLLLLFGGFLLNKQRVPVYCRWIAKLSFFNYAYEVGVTALLAVVKFQ